MNRNRIEVQPPNFALHFHFFLTDIFTDNTFNLKSPTNNIRFLTSTTNDVTYQETQENNFQSFFSSL